jgi:SET domain-containing protein
MIQLKSSETGFCIPYSVQQTPDKGRGVFAEADIPAGTIVWNHQPGLYDVHDELSFRELLAGLTHDEAVYELEHVLGLAEFPGFVISFKDGGELINHEDQPNLAMKNPSDRPCVRRIASTADVEEELLSDRFSLITLRDIRAGEELLLDYDHAAEDPDYYEALREEYGVTWEWMDE